MIDPQSYWPWWLGSLGLAGVSIAFYLVTGRTLGVSGSYDRVLRGRRALEAADSAEHLLADPAAMEAALRAATEEEFGADAVGPQVAAPARSISTAVLVRKRWLTWIQHVVFLGGLLLGGGVSALSRGELGLRFCLDAEFGRYVGRGWIAWGVLFVGGMLAGFGARLSGGCTSGNGLSGCGRLLLPSLVATTTFFAVGIATSLLLQARAL